MKNNKIHTLLGIITEPGTESKENWRYDELVSKLGIPEMEIMGYCDILEKVPLLLAQRQHDGYFSRSYHHCRKLYVTGQYKEDEIPVVKKSALEIWSLRVAIIEGIVLILVATPAGLYMQYNTKQLDKGNQELQGQILVRDRRIDSLQNLLDASEQSVQKLTLDTASLHGQIQVLRSPRKGNN